MLGSDDHEVINNENEINPEDLFGDDIVPPVSPDQTNGDGDGENILQTDVQDTDNVGSVNAGSVKKRREINRLANLNDTWLVNSHKENIHHVNSYFQKIKFKSGKGCEMANLRMILQRYEYFAQQCYPKLCFNDFVDKVEHVSGKRTIKNVLQDIRHGRTANVNSDDDDNANNLDNNDDGVMMDLGNTTDTALQPSDALIQSNSSETPLTVVTDEMREQIRMKRQQALEKRKQKLEESFHASELDNEDMPSGEENGTDITIKPTEEIPKDIGEDDDNIPLQEKANPQSEIRKHTDAEDKIAMDKTLDKENGNVGDNDCE